MIAASLRGIRGGVGTSATLAALAYALHAMEQKVLVVDMCPENTLGLHFNLDLAPPEGWARATLDQQPWNASGWQVSEGLCVLPYGHVTATEQVQLEAWLLQHPQAWRQRQAALGDAFDWVLFDLPQRLPGHASNPQCDFAFSLLNPDAACHVLLHTHPKDSTWLLVNHFDPGSQLQRDLTLIWQNHHHASLVPINLHSDEAMGEALACREPVGRYAPGSLIAQDIISFASWCLVRGRRLE